MTDLEKTDLHDKPTRDDFMDMEIVDIIERLERIEASQIETASLVKAFIEGIKPAVDEVLPKLEAIAESSWFRMITGGKKR
jgi:hypothetical protein